MRILVIGGTRFVGRHFTESGLRDGHDVTHFNRGESSAPMEGVETILGDRTKSLDALASGSWDWVLDTCGYVPRVVRTSAEFLGSRCRNYAFVSTISVYADFSQPINEQSPLATLEDKTVEALTNETYGGLKVLCEETVREVFGDRSLIIRPGMIVGPYDPTDRFTYWIWRASLGTPMTVPGSPTLPMQFIDARDLGDWIVRQMESETTGTFNLTGDPTTLGEVLGNAPQAHYLSGDDFRAAGIEPDRAFSWFTEGADDVHAWDVNTTAAKEKGLKQRPIHDTIVDTVAWAKTRPEDHEWRSGLTKELEEKLLLLPQK